MLEGLKAYRRDDGRVLLFRPEQNAQRMQIGAERLCMPSPSIEHFVEAVKQTVLANKHWVLIPFLSFIPLNVSTTIFESLEVSIC